MKFRITKPCTINRYRSSSVPGNPTLVEEIRAEPGEEYESHGVNGFYLRAPRGCYEVIGGDVE